MKLPWQLIGILAVIIAGLASADRFLAGTEAAEVAGAAHASFLAGSRLWKEGKPAEALDPLINAHAMERENPEYQLQLVGVLLDLNKTVEAEPLLTEILDRKPNDGRANLMAGRLAAKLGDDSGAAAYLHRAIYGDWPRDAAVNRVSARFELVRFLRSRGDREAVLPELISLEGEPSLSRPQRMQVARWFLETGSAARSAGVFRQLTEDEGAHDAAAWGGLGEALLEQGDYRGARTAFVEASVLSPGHVWDERMSLLSALAPLDPTPRRLPSGEKYRRALRILQMATADLQHRISGTPDSASESLLNEAAAVLSARPPQQVGNEDAERVLNLAEQIWKQRKSRFGPALDASEETLRLIMERLSG